MHDLSLCRSIASAVRSCSRGRRVRTIHLEIGALRAIDPVHLGETWATSVADSDLTDSRLDIRIVPIEIGCRSCSHQAELDGTELVCTTCGSGTVDVIGGDEVTIVSLDTVPVEEELAART